MTVVFADVELEEWIRKLTKIDPDDQRTNAPGVKHCYDLVAILDSFKITKDT